MSMSHFSIRSSALACAVFLFTILPASTSWGREAPAELVKHTLHSAALDRDMPLNVYLPPGYHATGHYPVLYLYHGQSNQESQWERLGLYEIATKLIESGQIRPLIIVMPRLENSFGVNNRANSVATMPDGQQVNYVGGRYEDYLRDDVVGFVDQSFGTIRDRNGRFVGGISMGGFAALHMAFRNRAVFSKVGGHSPALVAGDWPWLYPSDPPRAERDPQLLAKERDLKGLAVYLDCGLEDGFRLQAPTRRLAETLNARGTAVELHLRPGAHEQSYWHKYLAEYLIFYAGTDSPSP